VNWFRDHFLGLVHGHFDVLLPDEDIAQKDDGGRGGGINSGIGIVIPSQKIIETLNNLVSSKNGDETKPNTTSDGRPNCASRWMVGSMVS
jgi:hypothetical protein